MPVVGVRTIALPTRARQRPGIGRRDVLRVESTPRAGTHAELLTFYFPDVDGLTGELVMHWGTTVVPQRIEPPA